MFVGCANFLLPLLNFANKSTKVTEARLIMSITFGHVGCFFLDLHKWLMLNVLLTCAGVD